MSAYVREARSWVGVPFLHQGRSRDHGVDCLGLLVMVADALRLRFDGKTAQETHALNYTKFPCQHALLSGLEQYLSRIEKSDAQPGDVALIRMEGRAQHVGLLSDYVHGGLGLLHAYAPAGKVVEHGYDAAWQVKTCAVFRFIA